MPQNKTSFTKINFTILFTAFIYLFLYSSCSKEEDVDNDDIMITDPLMEVDTIPLLIGEYDPFYTNSFWEYQNAHTVYDDVIGDDVPDSLTTYRYYRKTALKDTIINQKKQRIFLTEHFEDENFQNPTSSSNAYHYFENDVYYANNQKYLDMNLEIGESWNTDTTSSEFPGGIIQNYKGHTILGKDTSIVINDKMYNDVVIVSSCNYSKLEGQDDFYCEVSEYRYYAKNVGLVHYSFCPPFQRTLINLLNYQIEN